MTFLTKINLRAKAIANTGFGNNNSAYGGRFVNKDGLPNVEKRGLSFFERFSWFHTMLQMPNYKFLGLVILFYALVNLLFAVIYLFIGLENLSGMNANTFWEKFGEAYFFSAQTFTTVGYGRINPTGFSASAVSSIEALMGLLSFAIATGLLYGRFSKPKAYLKFSHNAILAPYKNGLAIMMRVVPYKNNNLTDAEARLSVGLTLEENGIATNKFFLMDLEYSRVNALTLSWTIVHPINEESPFYKFTKDDYENSTGEILVFIKAFDDMFSNTVVSRSSYTLKEIILGAKFLPMYHKNEESDKTILDLDQLNAFTAVEISAHFKGENGLPG